VSKGWWKTLLSEQQGSGFADISGAEAVITVPVSDRLVTSLLAFGIPASGSITSIQLTAEPNQRFAVRLKLRSPAFLPSFKLRFVIVGQPEFPASPVLTCAVLAGGLGPFMGSLVRLFATLPPWIALNQERVTVNLEQLARHYQMSDLFGLLTDLRLSTTPGRFVVGMRAALPDRQ